MPEAATVHVLPLDVSFPVAPGETVFEAASRRGFYWPTRCCGQAQCMLCALEVVDGGDNADPPGAEEAIAIARIQSLRGPDHHCRLACRMTVGGPVQVRKDGVKPL